jgi:hypothetical protein
MGHRPSEPNGGFRESETLMLGQLDPVFPVRCSEPITSGSQAEFKRAGFVSLWIGTFASVEDAEASHYCTTSITGSIRLGAM